MSASTALAVDLRAKIARDEAELGAAFEALRERVVGVFEWRTWVRRRPALLFAGAFFIGIILSRR